MKANLVIDGNFILYRTIFSLVKTKTLFGDLERALTISINSFIKKYPYERIYMVSDSRATNWRKKIYPEYKGTRKKDEDIDWEFCFATYDRFKDNLKNNPRVSVLEQEGIEGDDWITHIVNKTNGFGYSNIIIASDGDLHQLLDFRLTPAWINVQYRDDSYKPKLFLPENYKIFFKEAKKNGGDIFDLNDNHLFIELLENWMKKMDHSEVDKEHMLFMKIIHGDSGDNIKSVLQTSTKTGKLQGIGEAGALKIWDKYKNDYPFQINFNEDRWIDDVTPYVAEYKKVDLDPIVESKIKENIRFNRRLVHLNQVHLPQPIMEALKSKF